MATRTFVSDFTTHVAEISLVVASEGETYPARMGLHNALAPRRSCQSRCLRQGKTSERKGKAGERNTIMLLQALQNVSKDIFGIKLSPRGER